MKYSRLVTIEEQIDINIVGINKIMRTGGLGDSGNYGLSGNETIVGYPQKADDIARKDFENRESDTYGNYL